MNRYIYLAGPVTGQSKQGAVGWRDTITEKLAFADDNFVGVSPLRCEPPDDNGMYPEEYSWRLAEEITAKNMLDVQRCDCVLAYMPKLSVGTLLEMGWAKGLNKTVVLVSPMVPVIEHPIVMATVPFRYYLVDDSGHSGWDKAIRTISDLLGVYC